MITEDINKEGAIKAGMNLERLANKYAAFLAAYTLQSNKKSGKRRNQGP